ncbi:response regulator [Lysinibacillus macroides]|uniref:histidine kinase n=1 Tax=Lysinibacillus macroides TaxID=33935 RepID=A0A0N0CX45_9BACI|nr:ATP-binding protein [Lysinibacillus macroides]KOY83814.1 histidine kinase [Lysinibacillus macroides]QPR67084.1 response regulator [Lysinibacillus macroides]
MKKLSLLFAIIIGSLLLTGVTFYLTQPSSHGPQAVKGVMDLRHYTFHDNAPVKLDGEWAFIPNHLVDQASFDTYQSYLVDVPSGWTKYTIDGQSLPSLGSGTYRLKILINDQEDVLGIKTNVIRMSNAIYINGQRIGQSGEPAEDTSYMPHNTPYTAYFSPDQHELELIVHVANFDYAPGGGIISSIFLGDPSSITKLREGALFYDLITLAAFLTMFIYFFGSYLYSKLGIEQLYFALFCFASALYTLTHGEKLLLAFVDMSYAPFQPIQMASSQLVGFSILLYFYRALPQYMNNRVVKVLSAIGILMMLTLILPASINSKLQNVNSLYVFINIVYIFYVQIIAIYRRAPGVMYLTLSSLAILLYFIVATLNTHINLELNALPPLLPFICLIMLSLYISHRFADSYLEKGKLTEALMRVDQLKDEFLAKTSHEFQTPLHGIIGISQSMLNDNSMPSLAAEQKEKVTLIFNIAERLSYLVNDILDFSKLKENELTLRITSVNLFAVTHMTIEVLSYTISKNVKIYNHIARGSFVQADENRLRQILYNLIHNAVKYTNKGQVDITCYEEQAFLVINVQDTGCGIAPENLKAIFSPFQQVKHSTDGTGLGLHITKELVERQGGKISVDSIVGQGTTFSVKLLKAQPIHEQLTAMPVQTYQQPFLTFPHIVERIGKKKLLIVDDDAVNLKVLIDILMQEGYSIIAIDNGEHVFDQLTQHPDIDLLILDIMMPTISGYEICQQIRENYTSTELPILMLTAAVRPEDMIVAFQSGANDFLHKPLDIAELKTRVRNLILLKDSAETAIAMETAFLQAQIKPHFVYNVLNSILSLSYLDLEQARIMITNFATFLRNSFAFENANSLVPLEKELSLIEAYINIHCTRYPEQLEWEICMDQPVHCLIPPLLLQPLVENALLHGLKVKKEDARLQLSIRQEQQMVIFKLTDNGIGMSPTLLQQIQNGEVTASQGIGLLNISKRLKKFENATIHFESMDNKGTTVEIRFPIISIEGM